MLLLILHRYLTVMYSVPYNHNFDVNWLGLGIHGPEELIKASLVGGMYNLMYWYEEQAWFTRKKFYYDTNAVTHTSEYFEVNGTMETVHRPVIQVRLYRNLYQRSGEVY